MSAIEVIPQTQAVDAQRLGPPKLGWTLDELARSVSVSVPLIRLEIKRGRLKAAHLGRRVVVLNRELRRYLAAASGEEMQP